MPGKKPRKLARSRSPRVQPSRWLLSPLSLSVIGVALLSFMLVLWSNPFRIPSLKIGMNLELTGDLAAVGESSQKAAELAVREINQSGGVFVGDQQYRLVLDIRNNQTQPQNAAALTKEFAEEGLMAMIGPNPSALAIAAANEAEFSKLLMISPWSTNPETTLNGDESHKQYVYRAAYLDPVQGQSLAEFATSTLKSKRAAVMYDDTAMVLSDQASYWQTAYKKSGTITNVEKFKAGDSDFTNQLNRIKRANPDVIFLPAYYQDAANIIKQARSLGITSVFVGSDAWEGKQLIELCEASCEGSYVSVHFNPNSSAKAHDFVKTYARYYNAVPDDVAALTYDSVGLLVQALTIAKANDRESVREAMSRITSYEGVTGTLMFQPGSGDPTKPISVMKIQGGELVP